MLKISDLTVEIGGEKKLDAISLEVKKGELHFLVGPNMSGKTTLAKTIVGLHKARGGGISFEGKNITKLEPEKREKLGIAMAFQHPPAIKGLKTSDLFEKLGVTQQKYLTPQLLERDLNVKFSGGEQKLVELAQVFALNPTLIIFDEIDSGVDIKKLEKIVGMIKDWRSAGKSAIVITHSATILEFLKPDVIHVLVNGKLICSSHDWKNVWNTIKRHGYEKCENC